MTDAIVRFAPSPTGPLHLGHVYAALYAWQLADADPHRFILRIDDLDHTRCRPPFIQEHIDDLHWLGISWQAAPLYQSQRLARYQEALAILRDKGVLYPCYLSRKEVDAILSAPQETPRLRSALSDAQMSARHNEGHTPAWRLDMEKIRATCPPLYWHDATHGTQQVPLETLGDSIIARKDIGTSYDLSVVLDDDDSGITLVTRGEDLFHQTHIHRLIAHLLDVPPPAYEHHKLITDDTGKRLAKRDDARSLSTYRADGYDADEIKKRLFSEGFQAF